MSTLLPGGLWSLELRTPGDGAGQPLGDGRAGERLILPGGATAVLLAPFPTPASRLWVAELALPGGAEPALAAVARYLAAHGRPIRYRYVDRDWPVSSYQTVYATEAGSAEMPSAGRAFTPELVTALVSRGVGVAPIVLHTGVSSLEAGEAPYPESYTVPTDTARKVNATHRAGGRVVAVGTTVVRALETVADDAGLAHPGRGWTDLVVTPGRGLRVVDGLLTGWHAPEASHLLLLEAVAGRPLLEACYAAALATGYLWHEFGDLHLVLP